MLKIFLLNIIYILLLNFTAYGIPLHNYNNNTLINLNMNSTLTNNSISLLNKLNSTAIQTRSYYSYGSNTSPAYYPAFDSFSVLASLAFLAFLLQSFTSLFDRSRSIIPAIVTSRNSSPNFQLHDPIKLIMNALDEYELFSNDIIMKQIK